MTRRKNGKNWAHTFEGSGTQLEKSQILEIMGPARMAKRLLHRFIYCLKILTTHMPLCY